MATVGDGGRAHINAAYFAFSPQWECFFFSYPTSQHARNLVRNPSMAMAVFDSNQVWGRPDRGLQLFGKCEVARGAVAEESERFYGERFPGFWNWRRIVQRTQGHFALHAYRFRPTRMKLFDERSFGSGVFVTVRVPAAPG